MILFITKYSIFAAMATITNISTQYIFLKIYTDEFDFFLNLTGGIITKLHLAMALGTLTGLLLKYFLDKKYIFYYNTESKNEDLFKFIIYTSMGIITTFIFWGSEIFFDYFFHFEEAKYIGAAVGLTAGYVIKYFLDKRFVFK